MHLTLLAALLLGAGDTADRPRHPLAPSLPVLTKAEQARIETVIERFVLYDTGKLTDAAGKAKATRDLYDLGPEAIFALLDGFNRAANEEASCPAVILGKKIESIINASSDQELITFARENIGAGVTSRRHRGMVQRLQTACLLRRGQLQQAELALARVPLAELERAADTAQGPRLHRVLQEIGKRQGPQVLPILAKAAAGRDAGGRAIGKVLLVKHVQRQPVVALKTLLRHDDAEVRAAAAQAVGARGLRFGDELIALLEDGDPNVGQAARRALARLAGGQDFGPAPDASSGDRETAVRRWRDWWERRP